MSNFILIVFCLAAGVLSRRMGWIAKDGYKALNAWVLYFGLPAISFNLLPKLSWDNTLVFTMLSPLVLFVGSMFFFYFLGKWFGISKRTISTMILVAGLSNTSFVGFPLIIAYFGDQGLPVGIVSDQTTFFLLSSIGVIVATKGSLKKTENINLVYIIRKLFSFPPLIGCILALILARIVDMSPLDPFFKLISNTVSPIALFSIGLQLNFSIVKSEVRLLCYAMIYKLILGPLLIFSIAYFIGLRGDIVDVSVFEMAMPALVGSSIVLDQFKLNTKLGNSVIGLSIPVALITTYIWYEILNFFLV